MNYKKILTIISAIIFINVLLAKPVYACEPIIQLVILYGFSLYFFFLVIPLKCAAFAYYEKKITKKFAVISMLLANIFSTMMGLVFIIPFSGPEVFFPFLLVIILVAYFPSKRLVKHFNLKTKPILVSVLISFLIIVNLILLQLAQSFMSDNAFLYWILKFLYIILALSISTGLTILWEEWIISLLAKKYSGLENESFMETVTKANLTALFIIALVSAGIMLPKRLSSPNFLIGL